jgi:protein-disulfide isomerase
MRKINVLLVLLLLVLSLSCEKKSENSSFVVAKVNGDTITLGDLDKSLGSAAYEAKKQLYDARFRQLEETIGEKILENEAKKRGVTLEALKQEALKNVQPVNEEELKRFYEMAKQRNAAVTKEEIKNYLSQRQQMIEERKFIDNLKAKAKIEKFISKLEPEMPRVKVEVGDDPFKGPENAKITIVEFTDFECPFCTRAHNTIEQVLKEYEGKIKFVRKDFPLAFHKNAMGAHLAANCAQDQGKYWEYTEKLWSNNDKLDISNLKKFAKEFELDMKKFNDCLDTQKYKAEIENDMKEGQKLGVRGTPAFFINGKMLSGARPYNDFKEIIDKEL